MKTYINPGYLKTVTVGADVESGEPIAIGTRAGVAVKKLLNGETGEFLQGGVIEFDKTAALALAQGDSVMWDIATKKVVAALGDFDLGEVDTAALAADATVKVLVNNMPYAFN